jgi:uracil-DNA glycosylase
MSTTTVTKKTITKEVTHDSESDEDEIDSKTKPKSKPKTKFMDEDEVSDSDDDAEPIKSVSKSVSVTPVTKLFNERPITEYIFADVKTYNFKTWKECFPKGNVSLRSLIINPAWNEFFDIIEKKPYFKNMERILSGFVQEKKQTVVPHAELVFNSFNVLSPKMIKVVFLGQDPYIGIKEINGKNIPQAMGFSFSVPLGYPRPPSLNNIYDNMVTFGHLKEKPEGGCLSGWVMQGCFMINASFTTFLGQSNAHKDVWKDFTTDLLKYLNNVSSKVVFIAWGKDAHNLCLNIDPYKNHIITSSHPSPYSYQNSYSGLTYGLDATKRKPATYPSFYSTDHFGKINQYLKANGKSEIFWDVIDVQI